MPERDPATVFEAMEDLLASAGWQILVEEYAHLVNGNRPFLAVADLQALGKAQGRAELAAEFLMAPRRLKQKADETLKAKQTPARKTRRTGV